MADRFISRREFLKQLSAAGLSISLGSMAFLGSSASMKKGSGPVNTAFAQSASSDVNNDPLSSAIKANLSTGEELKYYWRDDFSLGFNGWQYQYDTTGRTGITLTEEARRGNYALLLHSRKAARDQAWCRKGFRFPSGGISKITFGCYWTFHAINANNPESVNFEFDLQTAPGTSRYFFSVRYLNYRGGTQTKWQVDTGTPTAPSFIDVTGGTEIIPWNEQNKPMLSYTGVEIDFANKKYSKLYSNGNVYDVSGLGPAATSSLPNFDMGAVNVYRIVNRTDSNEECLLTLEDTFLGVV